MKPYIDRIKREPALVGGFLAAVADALISSPDWETALFVVLGAAIRRFVRPAHESRTVKRVV